MAHVQEKPRLTERRLAVLRRFGVVESDEEVTIYVHRGRCPSFCDYACNGNRGFELAKEINRAKDQATLSAAEGFDPRPPREAPARQVSAPTGDADAGGAGVFDLRRGLGGEVNSMKKGLPAMKLECAPTVGCGSVFDFTPSQPAKCPKCGRDWSAVTTKLTDVSTASNFARALLWVYEHPGEKDSPQWVRDAVSDAAVAGTPFDTSPRPTEILEPIAKEILERAGADVGDDSWNPDAHVTLTLSAAECRKVLEAVGRYRGRDWDRITGQTPCRWCGKAEVEHGEPVPMVADRAGRKGRPCPVEGATSQYYAPVR